MVQVSAELEKRLSIAVVVLFAALSIACILHMVFTLAHVDGARTTSGLHLTRFGRLNALDHWARQSKSHLFHHHDDPALLV